MYKQLLVFLFTMMATIVTAQANPIGGVVTSGTATIVRSPGHVQIDQSSQKAIIHWRSFNIGEKESVHFQQPRVGTALNRINPTQGASQIFGKLTATGQIILINPAGVFFGPSSYVNVGGIIASTTDISDKNFLEGKYIFDKPSSYNGSIVNQGTIRVAENGLVALVGTGVSNEGTIEANLGSVVLASGNKFTVDLSGNQLINFVIDEGTNQAGVDRNGNKLHHAVNNSGTIMADGGRVVMTAKAARNVLDKVVNMNGVIRANSVYEKNGVIILSAGKEGNVHVSGKIIASGKRGGKIKVLGKHVEIASSAAIDASGDLGGGIILIGGNYQGKGPEYNASTTFIDKGASIKANAIQQGDGGKIIAWADDSTRAYGNFSARGGALGGNGGLIETSGKYLDVDGTTVDTRAPMGSTGSWLLDPVSINIVAGSGITGITQSGSTTFQPTDTSTATVNLGVSNITTALASTNVIITTNAFSGGTGGAGTGDITLSTPLTWSSANSLTLSAYRNIVLNANITNTTIPVSVNLIPDNTGIGIGDVTGSGSVLTATKGNVNLYYNPTVAGYGWLATVLDDSNVTVIANPNTGNPNGDIVVSAPIVWDNVTALTLKAYRHIILNQGITNNSTPDANLYLIAGTSGNDVGDVCGLGATCWNSGGGTITPSPGGSVSMSLAGSLHINVYYNPFTFGTQDTIYTGGTSPTRYMPTRYMLINKLGTINDAASQRSLGVLSNNANSGLWVGGRNYALSKDIDATATSMGDTPCNGTGAWCWNTVNTGFRPIGSDTTEFTGRFDGLGHTIDNLYMYVKSSSSNTGLGLFGNTSGSNIRNLGLTNVSITTGPAITDNEISSLVGRNIGDISNVFSSGSITVSADDTRAGGLVGIHLSGTIEDSYSDMGVTANVLGNGGNYVVLGGFVGTMAGGTIKQSFSRGYVSNDVSGSLGSNYVGGFAGETTSSSAIIEDSASYTLIKGTVNVGSNDKQGGFIGNNVGTIRRSYATGYVGYITRGGFVGNTTGGTYSSDYWDTDVSGKVSGAGTSSNVAGVTGQTTAQLQAATILNTLNPDSSTNFWNIIPGVSYPYLKDFYPNTPRVISGKLGANDFPVNATTNYVIGMISNGSPLSPNSITNPAHGITFVGANEYYYFLQGNGVLSDGNGMLNYVRPIGSSTPIANAVTMVPSSGANLTQFDIAADNTVYIGNSGGGTISNALLSNAKGSLTSTDGILYSVSGNNVTLNNNISFSTSRFSNNGTIAVTYAPNGIITTTGTGKQFYAGTINLSGDSTFKSSLDVDATSSINTNGFNLALDVVGLEPSINASLLSGSISGGGSLTKRGTGDLRLSSSNSYTGGTTIEAGTLFSSANNHSNEWLSKYLRRHTQYRN